ncbi:MAG: MBL fold metallo-hydrolase [Streptosporangiaceae bacterium]
MFGGFWATAQDGFRFTSPRILRPEPGIHLAQGYDFSDLAFITTSDGVVAIDAGASEDRAKAALGDLDLPADAAISHLILTHAHWDHIGGAAALRGPGTGVIAQAGFPAGLDREQGGRPLFRYFAGAAGSVPVAVVPDQLISQPGLLRHPASITLTGLRRTALHRLMEAYQQTDPFKFLIYAEMAGVEIGPVQ